MTSRLPPDLLRLFTPRPPLKYAQPADREPNDKPKPKISGIAQYLADLKGAPKGELAETPQQRKQRQKKEHAIQAHDAIIRGVSTWDPSLNLQATEDPYKTIIVARLNYDTTEKDIQSEFDAFGPIASIKMVNDMDGNFRGYAFIEFEHEADMREAYRSADGMRILGRRVVVDVERGRTVKGWLPRRFAGGLGG
ncbi:U1 small nuclear ribonucleoprotein 70 kDa, partial [Martensiomyces pterosporus]